MRISLVMVTGGAGGLQQSIIPYSVALGECGHVVQVVMHARSPLVEEVRARGFNPDVVNGIPSLQFTSYLGVRRHLREFRPDLVIGFASKGYPVARLAAPKGVPVVTRLGSMDRRRIKKLVGAAAILATSDEMRDSVIALGQAPERVQVVPNFLIGDVQQRQRIGPNLLRIGSMGRFVRRKGFDILLVAAGLLKQRGYQFVLSIAGSGDEEQSLRDIARRLDLPVDWPGWVSGEAKTRFLSGLDVFVCPSRDEPFGQVYLEAMRHSIPIVTTDTVGARAIFSPGVDCRICPLDNPDTMANEIAALLDDGALRSSIGNAGAVKYSQSFHAKEAGRRLSDTLAGVLRLGP